MKEEMRDKLVRQAMTEAELMAFDIIRSIVRLRCAMDDDMGSTVERIRLDTVLAGIKKMNCAIDTILQFREVKATGNAKVYGTPQI